MDVIVTSTFSGYKYVLSRYNWMSWDDESPLNHHIRNTRVSMEVIDSRSLVSWFISPI